MKPNDKIETMRLIKYRFSRCLDESDGISEFEPRLNSKMKFAVYCMKHGIIPEKGECLTFRTMQRIHVFQRDVMKKENPVGNAQFVHVDNVFVGKTSDSFMVRKTLETAAGAAYMQVRKAGCEAPDEMVGKFTARIKVLGDYTPQIGYSDTFAGIQAQVIKAKIIKLEQTKNANENPKPGFTNVFNASIEILEWMVDQINDGETFKAGFPFDFNAYRTNYLVDLEKKTYKLNSSA